MVAAGNGERGRAWAVTCPGEVRNGNFCCFYPTRGIASSPKGLVLHLRGTAGPWGTGDVTDFSHEQRCRSSTGVQGAQGHRGRHQTPQPHSGQASKGTAGSPVRGEMGKLQERHSSRRSSSLLKALPPPELPSHQRGRNNSAQGLGKESSAFPSETLALLEDDFGMRYWDLKVLGGTRRENTQSRISPWKLLGAR